MDATLDKRFSFSITPNEAHEFILKLAENDSFRARLEAHPREVLAELHISLPQDLVPDNVLLPSKNEVKEALANFTRAGELTVRNLKTPFTVSLWPFVVFYWLYFTPARPPRRLKGKHA